MRTFVGTAAVGDAPGRPGSSLIPWDRLKWTARDSVGAERIKSSSAGERTGHVKPLYGVNKTKPCHIGCVMRRAVRT